MYRCICIGTAIGLLMLVAIGEATDPAESPLALPTAIAPGESAFVPLDRDGEKEDCYWQAYWGNPTFYWPAPNATYGYSHYAMRFSVEAPETLMQAAAYLYDYDVGAGTNDVYFTVWDDDGGGPGSPLAQVTLPAGTYPIDTAYTVADFSGHGLVFYEDFYLSISTSGSVVEETYEALVSDDGIGSTGRSYIRLEGAWYPVTELYADDFNFAIEAYLCPAAWVCGDVDDSGDGPDVADLVYMVNYMFADGPAPLFPPAANVDSCAGINVRDLLYLIRYMNEAGPGLICGPPSSDDWCASPEGSVALDHVDGLQQGQIVVGQDITFNLSLTTFDEIIRAGSMGWRVYGATDASGTVEDPTATWEPITWDETSSIFSGGSSVYWNHGFKIHEGGITGTGADTVGFGGIGMAGNGLPTLFEDVVFSIHTRVDDPGMGCKYLCIDSSYYRPAGEWIWSSEAEAYHPSWDGPHCFRVGQAVDLQPRGVPTRGEAPLTVMFDPGIGCQPDDYWWGFGDGDTSVLRNPTHVYESSGVYDVTLKVSFNDKDCRANDSVVREGYIQVTSLEAGFGVSTVAGVAPLTVSFSDQSDGDPDGWHWAFGDGAVSEDQDPSHVYDTAGRYDVSLRVEESIGGFSDSLLRPGLIRVEEAAFADLETDVRLSPFGLETGATVDFWCGWINRGSDQAANGKLWLMLPDQGEFVGVAPPYDDDWTVSGDSIMIDIGAIGPSYSFEHATVQFTLDGSVSFGDTLRTEAWLSSDTPDENPADNYCLHEQEVQDLSLTKNGAAGWKIGAPDGTPYPAEVEPEELITYWIEYQHPSPGELIDLTLTDWVDTSLNWSTFEPMVTPVSCDFDWDPYEGCVDWYGFDLEVPTDGKLLFGYAIEVKANRLHGTEIPNSGDVYVDTDPGIELGPVYRIVGTCCLVEGDVNGNGTGPDIADIVYLVNWMFKQGPEPPCYDTANIDQEGDMPCVADLVYLINYCFKQGPGLPPCP